MIFPRQDDLNDLCDLSEADELNDLCDVAFVAGWEPSNMLHDLARVSIGWGVCSTVYADPAQPLTAAGENGGTR